ncbi:TetR/AcrR family transcriptional regulator [Mycolicibacter kumamotonensis]|jgi:AcrR family transcriptional regulator|uniref:TetR family transcriptional regulator n=1 Tax=Mycolicibacter kumamotonensis TaxID=354243 RepID=A0A1B8SM11_9MYCO|nr:TetR/AcrR family transcriptional regulator [Mycolicibacter kumamotonensis]NDJ89581.1 TetR/AcrR family transcriptional regulator [Mycolicibacter kumamotonensis]OBY33710.1 TetR family transcriptional regulator [Mycolicibacter kumamotonensis]ORA77930.1 TetR family transcriptional regulator [Mycolicibacter kumamotonensis]
MPVDRTGERILDAALQAILDFGVRRASVEEIARRAGVSHMTVYRRWPTKKDLLAAVFSRVADSIFAAVDAEVAALDGYEDRFVAGFAGIYWRVCTHPMLSRTLETDPEAVLPALTTGAGPALELATRYLAGHIADTARRGGVTVDDPEGLAEIFVRLTHSLVLTQRVGEPLKTRADTERYARQHLLPLALAAVRPVNTDAR